jgi:two-component system, cell cycle sensor histidine kinase and response regulator CckA
VSDTLSTNLNNEISAAPISAVQSDLLSKPSSGRGLTILLVEDETFVRKAAAEMLAAAGYSAITARSAEEAIDICRQRLQPIDLLLADLILPGMSGRESADEFAKRFPDSSILLMTGYAEKIPSQNFPSGFTHLAKPISAAMLLQKIQELLANAALAARSIDCQPIPT